MVSKISRKWISVSCPPQFLAMLSRCWVLVTSSEGFGRAPAGGPRRTWETAYRAELASNRYFLGYKHYKRSFDMQEELKLGVWGAWVHSWGVGEEELRLFCDLVHVQWVGSTICHTHFSSCMWACERLHWPRHGNFWLCLYCIYPRL